MSPRLHQSVSCYSPDRERSLRSSTEGPHANAGSSTVVSARSRQTSASVPSARTPQFRTARRTAQAPSPVPASRGFPRRPSQMAAAQARTAPARSIQFSTIPSRSTHAQTPMYPHSSWRAPSEIRPSAKYSSADTSSSCTHRKA